MTIDEAIARLAALRSSNGDVDVYADCPTCGQSFAVNVVVRVVQPAVETVRLADREPLADK